LRIEVDSSKEGDMREKGAEVVVIGAGLAGLACAYFCAKAGLSNVILLEKDGVFSKASGATFGCLAPSFFPVTMPHSKKLGDRGLQTIKNFAAEEDVDLELRTMGLLNLFWTPEKGDEARAKVRQEQDAGYVVSLLEQKELKEVEPELSPQILGAIYKPDQCHLNPLKLAGALYKKGREKGVRVHTFTKIKMCKHKGDQLSAIVTEQGDIETSVVVNAAGPWASEVGKLMGADIPVAPLKGQGIATEPLPEIVRNIVLDLVAVVQDHPGNVIAGGTKEPVGFDTRSTHEAFQFICSQAARLFPKLRKVTVLRTWAGLRAVAPDRLPILGEVPGLKSVYLITGLADTGVLTSVISGKLVAELIAGKSRDPLLDPFSLSRFTGQKS
jgi:sarcosine oxidase subunit beta